MGLVREPDGVDLVVGPSTLTESDKDFISSIIANYKLTGKIPRKQINAVKRKSTTTNTKQAQATRRGKTKPNFLSS